MSEDIFYSQVNKNLQEELDSRGKAGFRRNNDDLNFMLGKIANIEIIPYKSEIRSADNEIPYGRLGGETVRSGEFLPSGPNGFMQDRKTTYKSSKLNPSTGKIVKAKDQIKTNSTRRIPPFITSADITIGDHSLGLMNSSTIQFIIPNPDHDLNFIEAVYFRPGRHVTVTLQHPKSAIITRKDNDGLLSKEKKMPSSEKLKKLYPDKTEDDFKSVSRNEYGYI